MGSEEEKTKHSLKRKRNILAKRLRTEREFLPKIHDVKPVTREKKLTPRTLEEYLDDTDNDHT